MISWKRGRAGRRGLVSGSAVRIAENNDMIRLRRLSRKLVVLGINQPDENAKFHEARSSQDK